MGSSCPLGISRVGPARKSSPFGYDQAGSQDGWILVSFFFCVFIDFDLADI